MAKRINMFVLVAVMVASTLFQSSVAQTSHVVGDSAGWTIPSAGGAATYTTWASQQTFAVGDILVFNFVAGRHDVTKVTKAEFDDCTATNPISTSTASPTNITLTSTGEHYFICTVSGHCNAGQKLSINVPGAATPAPTPSTATPPSSSTVPSSPSPSGSTTPPPPSSAPSLTAATLPVFLLSFVVALLH